jgi:Regulator of ribonuclease activity B
MITRDQLESFFSETRNAFIDGRAKWSIDELCTWSYFFVDHSAKKLAPVAGHLDSLGYEIVGYLEPDPEDVDQIYYLRADRIGSHGVDSLLARNAELYAIASQLGVSNYDGMDVGAVDGP